MTVSDDQVSERTMDDAPSPSPSPTHSPSKSPSGKLAIGDALDETYEIRGVLGSGRRGVVCRVFHRGWGREVAMTTLSNELISSEADVSEFASLCLRWINVGVHPNVASCYYLKRIDGALRLFNECVEGDHLSRRLAKSSASPDSREEWLEEWLDVAIQIARGLRHAHKKKVPHGALNADKVILVPDGEVKLTGFAVGSYGLEPKYAGDAVAETLDFRCFGRLLLCMLAESPPPEEVVSDSASGEVWNLDDWKRRFPHPAPAELLELIAGCLDDSFHEQVGDMAAVVERLRELYRDELERTYPRELNESSMWAAPTLNNVALCCVDLDECDKAEAQFVKALNLDPTHLEVNFNHLMMNWRRCALSDVEVVERFSELEERHRFNWKYHYLLGSVQLERSNARAAEASLAKAARMKPDCQEAGLRLNHARKGLDFWARRLHSFVVEDGDVSDVTFSPDGTRLLSGNANYKSGSYRSEFDLRIRLWDLKKGGESKTFGVAVGGKSGGTVGPLSFVDSEHFLSGSMGGRFWAIEPKSSGLSWFAEKAFLPLRGDESSLTAMAVSPDGTRCALAVDGEVSLHALPKGKRERRLSADECARISRLTFTPNGAFLIGYCEENHLHKCWDVSTGKCLQTSPGAAWFCGDGNHLLVEGEDGCLRMTDWKTGELIRQYSFPPPPKAALTPDERFVLGIRGQRVEFWSLRENRLRFSLDAHPERVSAIAISPDGGWLATGGASLRPPGGGAPPSRISVWDISELSDFTSSYELVTADDARQARREALAIDKLLDSVRERIESDDVHTASELLEDFKNGFDCADDPLILALEGGLHVKGRRLQLKRRVGEGRFVTKTPDGFMSVDADSEFGKLVVAGKGDFTLWDASKREMIAALDGRNTAPGAVAFSPDGASILLGDAASDRLCLWRIAEEAVDVLIEEPDLTPTAVAFGPDGRRALVGTGKHRLLLVDLRSGEVVETLNVHRGEVRSVAFSMDGRRALTGGGFVKLAYRMGSQAGYESDKTIRLWDLDTGEMIREFNGHIDAVNQVAFTGDGRFVVSCSEDNCAAHRYSISDAGSGKPDEKGLNSLKIWDARTGECLANLIDQKGVSSFAITSDDRFLFSAGLDETILLRDFQTWEIVERYDMRGKTLSGLRLSRDGQRLFFIENRRAITSWFLEWTLAFPDEVAWDEAARPYLEQFLELHGGRWVEGDWNRLVADLRRSGLGWIDADGVGVELEKMRTEFDEKRLEWLAKRYGEGVFTIRE